jgi:hypothetical protein
LQYGGILSPLRLGLFRALWLANLVSATGTTVQGVGAAWLMTTLAGTPEMVALVQTATHTPILLFALLAGTLAALWDRRRVLLLAQLWTALTAAGLALLSSLGLVTPSLLLLFTFFVGPRLAGERARDRAARGARHRGDAQRHRLTSPGHWGRQCSQIFERKILSWRAYRPSSLLLGQYEKLAKMR